MHYVLSGIKVTSSDNRMTEQTNVTYLKKTEFLQQTGKNLREYDGRYYP